VNITEFLTDLQARHDEATARAGELRSQIELLNRKRWKTRVESANAIFEYIEVFHNRRRRHSALGYRTPMSTNYSPNKTPSPPPVSHRSWNPNRGARHLNWFAL
jgi:transposase InsO family protein